MHNLRGLVSLACVWLYLSEISTAAPQGFPSSGNGLWYTQPGKVWLTDYLPVGNGRLAAMVPGGTTQEAVQLNLESLWTGGPFADPSYNGGNKLASERASVAQQMQNIRNTIFQAGTIGNISVLFNEIGEYGSFAGAGHLVSTLGSTASTSNYARWLDLDQGLARTSWTQNGVNMLRTIFCSHPAGLCVKHLEAQNNVLPSVTVAFSNAIEAGLPAPNITCQSDSTLLVHGQASTNPPSMAYAILVQASTSSASKIQCVTQSSKNATLVIPASSKDVTITWTGDTEYDMNAGDASHKFTFRGEDPVQRLRSSPIATASVPDYATLLRDHIADIKSVLSDSFSLNLGQQPQLDQPTDVVKASYKIDGTSPANAYLDWVIFNYGRYMLATSARGTLPANLQGKWGDGVSNAWSADYHANINLQMNYWSAEPTGMGALTRPIFDYIEKTWAPRGVETAMNLYNISRGWATHNELNIFGHTGMKNWGPISHTSTDYTEATAWMMMHAWDHFDYGNDITWWKTKIWPLLKGAVNFQLDKLLPDRHFNDSSLVVIPCNSPEQGAITFGCAHSQQVIWQMFNMVEKGFEISGDTDTAFLQEVRSKRAQMDKGIRIGSWGQLQEWKIDMDSPTDHHRHLSHLIGLYPGYTIVGYNPSLQGSKYTRQQVIDAAAISLDHRGNGTGPDADSGWEKVWRAATWAQLGNKDKFYHMLSFAVPENFAPNLFSVYDPNYRVFQIDANLGFPGAVMNALIQAPDTPDYDTPITVTLLPAVPTQWATGSVRGARVRGGMSVDIAWKDGKMTSASLKVDGDNTRRRRSVNVVYDGKVISSFTTSPGLTKTF